MSRETEFLKLYLPDTDDVYNVEKDQNENFEKIDTKLKEWDTGKENSITKKTGFNLDKTDEYNLDDSSKLGTAKALKRLFDEIVKRIGMINWSSLTGKPTTFPPSTHSHAWTSITNRPDFISSVASTSVKDFATPLAVKLAYDRCTSALSEAGKKEPAFAKNNAFNKNFGVVAGTVMEGSWYREMFRTGNFLKSLWSGKYLAPLSNSTPLCTLPTNWEICIVTFQWSTFLANSYGTAILHKNYKGGWHITPGGNNYGESRFTINGSNQLISQGSDTTGNDCYVLRVDYI